MTIQLYTPQAIYEQGQRANQEDSIFPATGKATAVDQVFLVCDGMGGHEKGEVASSIVCDSVSSTAAQLLKTPCIFDDNMLAEALKMAYDNLDAADELAEGRMGTTMTFLCLHRGGCLAAHIGDSRVYHLRPKTGEVLYRSRDDSLVQELYEMGQISYDEMSTSPRRNIILKAMQPHQEERAAATVVHITDILPDDYFYLCSDGMLENMDDNDLMDILRSDLSDEQKADKLKYLTAGNSDNHSAYLLHVKDVVHETNDELLYNDEPEIRDTNKVLNDEQRHTAWKEESADEEDDHPTVTAKKHSRAKMLTVGLIAVFIAAAALCLLSLII